MAKDFLSEEQKETLEAKGWDVNSKGCYLTFYKDEYNHGVWKKMCEIAGVDSDSNEFTTLIFGTKSL
jgi:hypothetical protein